MVLNLYWVGVGEQVGGWLVGWMGVSLCVCVCVCLCIFVVVCLCVCVCVCVCLCVEIENLNLKVGTKYFFRHIFVGV